MTLWSEFSQHRGRLVQKWDQYFPAYDRHFTRFRNQSVTILEIGVNYGGSLQLWRRYFGPLATIVGIDIDPATKQLEDPMTSIRIGDQSDPVFLNSVMAEFGPVQIIIDDGSHKMIDIVKSFSHLYNHQGFDTNGIYAIEDIHTSYYSEYGGGHLAPGNFVEIAKHQIDELNAHHTRGVVNPTFFTSNTLSMHFYDSLIIYERGRRSKNRPMEASDRGTFLLVPDQQAEPLAHLETDPVRLPQIIGEG